MSAAQIGIQPSEDANRLLINLIIAPLNKGITANFSGTPAKELIKFFFPE
jgi:hypothetical protein